MSVRANKLGEIASLERGVRNLAPADCQFVGLHHATVKPMHDAAATNAADHADVRPVDLCHNVADEKLRQSRRIRQCCRRSLHSHHRAPAFVGAHIAHHRTNTISALSASEHKTQTQEKAEIRIRTVVPTRNSMHSIVRTFATGGRSCVSSEL